MKALLVLAFSVVALHALPAPPVHGSLEPPTINDANGLSVDKEAEEDHDPGLGLHVGPGRQRALKRHALDTSWRAPTPTKTRSEL